MSRLRHPPVPMVLYTRRTCPLCDEMKEEIGQAGLSDRFELREVDIDSDPELVGRFGTSIPVLEIAGRVAFKGRLERERFRVKFERLSRAWLERERGT